MLTSPKDDFAKAVNELWGERAHCRGFTFMDGSIILFDSYGNTHTSIVKLFSRRERFEVADDLIVHPTYVLHASTDKKIPKRRCQDYFNLNDEAAILLIAVMETLHSY